MHEHVGRLARITIYPLKSLDGVDLEAADVLACGALADDRRWRLVDRDGRVVNAKRTARLQAVRATFDLAERRVHLAIDPRAALPGDESPAAEAFPLVPGAAGPCAWLGAVVGYDLLLEERTSGGFPDDRDAPGPTLVGGATLDRVAGWFGLSPTEVRRRFRVNLEVEGPEAFWEDTLACPLSAAAALESAVAVDPYAAAAPRPPRRFGIGTQVWEAGGVCRRCPVPARDSVTGRDQPLFREAFETRRRRALRSDVDASDWTHLYRLAINTIPHATGGRIAVGDAVSVLG